MSLFDRFLPSALQPARRSPPAPAAPPARTRTIPEWEKLSDDTLRQELDQYGSILVRVFDFEKQVLTIDGTGRGTASTMEFKDVDPALLHQARREMTRLGGYTTPDKPVQLSEEWHQLSADVIEQTSKHSSRMGINTVRKVFDFVAEKILFEIIGVTVASTQPFSTEDASIIDQARTELGKFKQAAIQFREATILPFKKGTLEDVVAPQKASFRKKSGRTLA